MPTEKRHIYSTGTVNVETGNVVVKQDINYFNASDESAMKSIIRYVEDEGIKFRQNQIYDGLGLSSGGGSLVNISVGNGFVGGRWGTVDSTNIDFASSGAGDYHVFIRMTANVDSPRNPSTGETFAVTFEPAGDFAYRDNDLFLGNVNLTDVGVVGVISNVGSRRSDLRYIRPYGTATQVSVLTGTAPAYISAFDFKSTSNQSNLPFVADDGLQINQGFSGTTIETTGVVDVGGDFGVASDTYLSGTLQVDGITNLYSTLNVTNAVYLSGTLKTDGQVDLFDKLYVTDDVQLSGALRVEGRSDVEGVLEVGGNVHFSGSVWVNTQLRAIGNFYVTADSYLSGALEVDGIVNLYGTNIYAQELYVSGTIGTDGDITSATDMLAEQFHSAVIAGTPPLTVVSTDKVLLLNVDRLDDLHAGNATGEIPISNDTLNTDLDADKLDGQHGTYYAIASELDTHEGLANEHIDWTLDDASLINPANLRNASTSVDGMVQLNISTSSTSTTLAATSSAVKSAYDIGNHSHPYAATSHTHTMPQSDIDEITYPSHALYSGILVGDVSEGTNNLSNLEFIFGTAGTGEIWFYLPYVDGKDIDYIELIAKSSSSSTSIKCQVIKRFDNGTSSGIGTDTAVNWGTSQSAHRYGLVGSNTNSAQIMWIRVRRTITTATTINIQGIVIRYSD